MQPRIWACSIGLALSWLISPVMSVEALKLPTRQAQNSTTAKPIIVSKAEFGVLRVEEDGKTTLIPTKKYHFNRELHMAGGFNSKTTKVR